VGKNKREQGRKDKQETNSQERGDREEKTSRRPIPRNEEIGKLNRKKYV
jgi:hypothetical protein